MSVKVFASSFLLLLLLKTVAEVQTVVTFHGAAPFGLAVMEVWKHICLNCVKVCSAEKKKGVMPTSGCSVFRV